MTVTEQLLSIGDIEERTGVPSPTLRSWERRVGFPAPLRSAGGQRRYRESDALLVSRVQAERDRGLSLTAAVEAVQRGQNVGAGSLFAYLRSTHPQLDVLRIKFGVMRALTSAIEDECMAHASRPILLGCFQNQRSFEVAGRRWNELARGATSSVVFSDFEANDLDTAPCRVALPADSPMLNEWSLVCHDPHLSVALVAWERLSPQARPGPREFEALLVTDPGVVREAVQHCLAVATEAGVTALDAVVDDMGALASEDPRRSISLLRRFALYTNG